MIGVISRPVDIPVVEEFFELFKTPWEFYQSGRSYDVLVCAADITPLPEARVVIVYSAAMTEADVCRKIAVRCCGPGVLLHGDDRLPVYGNTAAFPNRAPGKLQLQQDRVAALWMDRAGTQAIARVGYDLFAETRTLLQSPQPVEHAAIPTLELHIAVLRDLITSLGVELLEIPPVPCGYKLLGCLTHDVDHPSIRRHQWDHTVLGFAKRAVVGSSFDVVRGRISAGDWATNVASACMLPLTLTGRTRDFWSDFDLQYAAFERGLRSTFFVLPFADRAGSMKDAEAPAYRAARYGARDIASNIQRIRMNGNEVGLHGIDAWCDPEAASQEIAEIRSVSGDHEIGVRMHWLFYDGRSAEILDAAGATYDSTLGYNQTVGFAAGTTQAFRPPGSRHLLELSMNAMDTALFFPCYLGLTAQRGTALLREMMATTSRFGGCLTINWHDRSLAPERLWEAPYRNLIKDLKARGAWVTSAGQAVAWFRKRRSAEFVNAGNGARSVQVKVTADGANQLPGLTLRRHLPRKGTDHAQGLTHFEDLAVDESPRMAASCLVGR